MSAAALLNCIEREIDLVSDFIDAIEAETAALLDRKAHESLKQAAATKERLGEQLNALNRERDTLLAAMGLPPGHDGTEQAVALHPELADAWDDLLALADQAREGNARNALLISVNLRYTEQTIEALRQITQQVAPASTYDASGRGQRSPSSQRSIVAT